MAKGGEIYQGGIPEDVKAHHNFHRVEIIKDWEKASSAGTNR